MSLIRITPPPDTGLGPWRVHDAAVSRALEHTAAASLPPHTLMDRAGHAVAQLAKAIAPHARSIWVACGPGNNGGDGLRAAALLQPWAQAKGATLEVSWAGDEARMPDDARWALQLARDAGVTFTSGPPARCDLVIDALLGLGLRRPPSHTSANPPGTTPTDEPDSWQARLQHWLGCFRQIGDTLLCVDNPSDLDAETGTKTIANKSLNNSGRSIFSLSLLSLKAGLFTHEGRDAAGEVWFDDLGTSSHLPPPPVAGAPALPGTWLHAPASHTPTLRAHASHKGSYGDVWILGGQGMPAAAQPGVPVPHLANAAHAMTGALLLAARAALHGGAGRVFALPLPGANTPSLDPACPELMFRGLDVVADNHPLPDGTWVVGCGGGTAIVPWLSKVLRDARQLVLDADALNAIAASTALQHQLAQRAARRQRTVLTPHPLEAARLTGLSAAAVQGDRLDAARRLAAAWHVVCVLKGSGTVIATPDGDAFINLSGNARLACAGTGDVLAGLLGARLAPLTADDDWITAVRQAVWQHGHLADIWPPHAPLTASALAQALTA